MALCSLNFMLAKSWFSNMEARRWKNCICKRPHRHKGRYFNDLHQSRRQLSRESAGTYAHGPRPRYSMQDNNLSSTKSTSYPHTRLTFAKKHRLFSHSVVPGYVQDFNDLHIPRSSIGPFVRLFQIHGISTY